MAGHCKEREDDVMLTMRPAASTDKTAVEAMISARCDWMEERGLPSWRASLDDLVSQTGNHP
jgi:hypothetical protein